MEEATCKVTFNAQSDSYKEVTGFKCGQGLTCADFEDTGANDVEFAGVCKPKKCFGEGPAHRKDDKDDGEAVTGTHRVTICHRTCSETNPWVRITIDDDAWNPGNMCGHGPQHNVTEECKGKDLTKWGKNRIDYLLYDHGTHEDVRKQHGFAWNSAEEKEYWRHWEHACPYVRNGKCCDWGSENCCGDKPAEPTPNAVLEPVCGNGKMEEGETCDDGNTIDGDGCDSNCQIEPDEPEPVCGNGKMEEGETCDDGNTIDGDGCDSNCQIEPDEPEPVCGNGKMEEGETCDDGNTIDGDGCDSNCRIEPDEPEPVCGNGKMEEGETCDDGNTIDGDGCDSNCRIEPNQRKEPCPDDDEPTCGMDHKTCTHDENFCCDGLVCSGYLFHKMCQPEPVCLKQLYVCDGGETPCCGDMVCTTLDTGRKVCDHPVA